MSKFKVGDKVQIDYFHDSVWNGEGVVTKAYHDNRPEVRMTSGEMVGCIGVFDASSYSLINPAVSEQPRLQWDMRYTLKIEGPSFVSPDSPEWMTDAVGKMIDDRIQDILSQAQALFALEFPQHTVTFN